jgi:uncharacterized caspase-like protein
MAVALFDGAPCLAGARLALITQRRCLHVLAVGIDNYGDVAPKLQYAVTDANAVAAAFKSTAIGGDSVFSKVDVRVLRDADATEAGVSTAIDQISSTCSPDDVFVFYYSGIGVSADQPPLSKVSGTPASSQVLLPLSGCKLKNGRIDPDSGAISGSLLRNWLARMSARHRLVLVDASYGGDLTTGIDSLSAVASNADRGAAVAPLDTVLISPAGQELDLAKAAHGLFTSALLSLLQGTSVIDSRHWMQSDALVDFLPAQVRRLAASDKYLGSISDFQVRLRSTEVGNPFPVFQAKPAANTAQTDKGGPPTDRASPEDADPAPAPDGTPMGVCCAVFFATDHYTDSDALPALQNPIDDADALAETLHRDYGFRTEVVKDPTEKIIRGTLDRYKSWTYADGDQLLVSFSGHGLYDPDAGEGYVAARDTDATDPTSPQRALAYRTLANILQNTPCKHICLLLDTCYSGTFDPQLAIPGNKDPREPQPDLDGEHAIAYAFAKLRYNTRKFLTAGRKESVSDGMPGGHSPFTWQILQVLRSYGDGDNGRMITFRMLSSQLLTVHPEPLDGDFGTSEPGSDFIFMPPHMLGRTAQTAAETPGSGAPPPAR